MATNLSSNGSASKVTASSSSNPPTLSTQTSFGSSGDGYSQRRSGGSGSFGAGAATRTSGPAPRNKQTSRSQHKGSRRYRFTDEDAIAESAAMNSTRNRKGQTSITHLMNFSLPPRPSNFQHFHTPRHVKRNATWGLGSGYHAVDKARYVHANYRFIVDPNRDYRAQSIDADVYLEWNSILQILASPQSQAAACPICLGDPVAPRMAKCGHIFCLHCLIRYMHSTDDTSLVPDKRARWKKCPICEDSVYISETRPVRWYIGQEGPPPRDHEDIVLRLVMRPAGSTLALPRDSQTMGKSDEIPWQFAVDVMDFARVMKGSTSYMEAQFDEELAQIEEVERHDELMFGEDNEWTSRAARVVRDAKEKAKTIGNPPVDMVKPDESKQRKRPAGTGGLSQDAPEMYVHQQATRSGQSLPTAPIPVGDGSKAVEEQNMDRSDSTTTPSALSNSIALHRAQQQQQNNSPPSDYYFYQALLHHYLSPLDIRILKAAFGEFSQFPSTILPRVEHVSTGHVVDDELRRRTKYLSHLPYGCEVSFLECDWTDTVPAEVLAHFKPEIERRRKRNEEKEAREEKERQRAERVEEAKGYAAARRKRPTSPVERFKADDFEPLAPNSHTDVAQSVDGGHESTSPMWRQGGSGFASLGSPGTSPTASRTVWGTTAVVPLSPEILPQDIAAPQDDGWLQGWERDILAEEDLIVRTQQASLQSSATPQSGGKRKKGKKITLMSTTARRGA